MRRQELKVGEVFEHRGDGEGGKLWIVRRVSPGAAYVQRILAEAKEVTMPDGRTFTARATGGTVAIAPTSFVDRVEPDPTDLPLMEAIQAAHTRTARDDAKQATLNRPSKKEVEVRD